MCRFKTVSVDFVCCTKPLNSDSESESPRNSVSLTSISKSELARNNKLFQYEINYDFLEEEIQQLKRDLQIEKQSTSNLEIKLTEAEDNFERVKAQYEETLMKLEISEVKCNRLEDELNQKSITETNRSGGTNFSLSPVFPEIPNKTVEKNEPSKSNPKETVKCITVTKL